MNWQTDKLIQDALDMVNDRAVFTDDQIKLLKRAITFIAMAMEKEFSCNKTNHIM